LIALLSYPTIAGVKYFLNDDIVKHRAKLPAESMTLQKFSEAVRMQNKLTNDDFAVFSFDPIADKLRIMKEASSTVNEDTIYYVIENNRLDKLFKKVEGKIKKGTQFVDELVLLLFSDDGSGRRPKRGDGESERSSSLELRQQTHVSGLYPR
jgi:hypothetical protein